MKKGLISVLMCVYNTNPVFLQEAIDSILTQSYSEFEFVIVDDGSSSQETIAVLSRMASVDSRIVLITNKENIGLTKSLNIGLKMCSGEYIARMDADDISLSDRLEVEKHFLDDNLDVMLVGTDTISFDEVGNETDSSKLFFRVNDMEIRKIHLLYQNDGLPHPTFMLRNCFLKEKSIQYREDLKRAQDYGMTVDILINGGDIARIPLSYLKYRVHGGQISSRAYSEQVECQAKTAYRYLKAKFRDLSDDEAKAVVRMNHESDMYSPKICIRALRKMIKENRLSGEYNQRKFVCEFKLLWYHKFMQMTRLKKRFWGIFYFFSLSCVKYALIEKFQELRFSRRNI